MQTELGSSLKDKYIKINDKYVTAVKETRDRLKNIDTFNIHQYKSLKMIIKI